MKSNIQDRIQRIQIMEQYTDMFLQIIKDQDIKKLLTKTKELKRLKDYYESNWKQDYELEEQNYFPKDLKRGVLSQDLLYNVFEEIKIMENNMEHNYYYRCGVIDAFNEVVKAGVKDLALSHPSSYEEIEEVLPYAKKICKKYGTSYEVEPNLLITDLFPYSANKGKTVILFYKKEAVIQKYHALKKCKEEALLNHTYDAIRKEIAQEFGKLLSYSEEAIETYIINNKEKES